MKNTFLALGLLIFTGAFASAQMVFGEPVEEIGKRISADSTLYPQLAERFSGDDTTLTLAELGTLYYGSAFLPEFDPYREERIIDAADALARREKPYDALNLLDNFLSRNPASLRALLEKAYNLWVVDDSLETGPAYKRYFQMLKVPLASGTGESPETAYVIRSVQDQELVLNELNLVGMNESLIMRNGQSFHVVSSAKENDIKNRKNVYFNVELPLKRGKQQSLQNHNGQ
ncbi:MAG: DUF4919 domain-containing protein [Saprospiraceae bacterium]